MKFIKFVTGLLLAFTLVSFVSMASLMKVSATESRTNEEEVQVILPDTLSEEDEKAIHTMIATYQRSRSSAPEQLETQISNYFEMQYGTARSNYVVEFKLAGNNGSISGRLIYILMGNDAAKCLNQVSGGFVAPVTNPKTGYAFSNWSIGGTAVESEDLAAYSIYGSSIIYAEFMPDTDGDGIPDHKQEKFNIQFSEESDLGTVSGDQLDFIVYKPINGENCYISQAVGFQVPETIASIGYAFDYWVTSEEKVIDDFDTYQVDADLVISAAFAVDRNDDGIPDHKQTLYEVEFMESSGGAVVGNTNFFVSTRENGSGEQVGYFEDMYPGMWNYPMWVYPEDGYILEYWIDQKGDIFYPLSTQGGNVWGYSWEKYWEYEVKCDTAFAAVFAEDINADGIPDYKQTFLSVEFMATSGGSLVGETQYTVLGIYDEEIGYVGNMEDASPYFDVDSFEVVAEDGYILDYWLDHMGNQYGVHSFISSLYEPCIKGDTVFVAVFTKKI